jgi:hypothetical protein
VLGTDHLTCRGEGYGFLFRSELFFRTTRELEYLFFLSRIARNLFLEFNIRLYDKNSESDYFFFLHQNQNIFFSNIGNQNIFLEKKHTPPPFKLNGRSLMGDDIGRIKYTNCP